MASMFSALARANENACRLRTAPSAWQIAAITPNDTPARRIAADALGKASGSVWLISASGSGFALAVARRPGATATATPIRMTVALAICEKVRAVFIHDHSSAPAIGEQRHNTSMTESREPIRGRA